MGSGAESTSSRWLDHDAVSRVVQRAIEIDSDRDALDADSGMHVEAVIAAAEEAGIDPAAVREAVAWERLGPPPEPARFDRAVGGASIVVDRLIRASVADLLEQLDAWMTVGHHLRREVAERVAHGDEAGATIEWAKRDDLAASVQRSVRSVAGGAALGTVRRVGAALVPVEADHTVVRLIVDRRTGRRVSLVASGGVGAASVAGGAAVAATLAAPATAVVAAPGLLVAGGAAVASRRRATSLERELRRLLDQIDAGERPATIVGGVAQRLGLRRV